MFSINGNKCDKQLIDIKKSLKYYNGCRVTSSEDVGDTSSQPNRGGFLRKEWK